MQWFHSRPAACVAESKLAIGNQFKIAYHGNPIKSAPEIEKEYVV